MPISVEQVRRCYGAILRREPSQGEIRLWTGPANSGRGMTDMAAALVAQATEVRSIARLYGGLLGRLPESITGSRDEADGLAYWTGVLRSFRSEYAGVPYREALTYLVEEWLREPELMSRFGLGTIDQYVAEVCKAVLDRAPQSHEAVRWAEIATDPERGRARLAVTLCESEECKARFNASINEKLLDQATGHLPSALSPQP